MKQSHSTESEIFTETSPSCWCYNFNVLKTYNLKHDLTMDDCFHMETKFSILFSKVRSVLKPELHLLRGHVGDLA